MFKTLTLVFSFLGLTASAAFADGVGTVGPSSFTARTGEGIYKTVCQSCHMQDAKGAAGAGYYPSLAGDANLAAFTMAVYTVMYGRRGMPGFGGTLDDEQISNVINYLRQNFSNSYQDTVSPSQVKALRRTDYIYPDLNG